MSNGLIAMTQYHPAALSAIVRIIETVMKREYPLVQELQGKKIRLPGEWGIHALNFSGPVKLTHALEESNMSPKPHRCTMKDRTYNTSMGNLSHAQEYWVPSLKFDAVKNCFLDDATSECKQTPSMKEKGYQDAATDGFEYDRKVVRPLTIDEGGGDVRDAMKKCKLCNDYLALARDRAVYCDEPGEPCNVNTLPDPEPSMEPNKPHFYDWLFSDRSRLYFLSGINFKEPTEVGDCLCSAFNISLSAGVFFNGITPSDGNKTESVNDWIEGRLRDRQEIEAAEAAAPLWDKKIRENRFVYLIKSYTTGLCEEEDSEKEADVCQAAVL